MVANKGTDVKVKTPLRLVTVAAKYGRKRTVPYGSLLLVTQLNKIVRLYQIVCFSQSVTILRVQ